MKICQVCSGPRPSPRRKFCSDACYAIHRQGYQRAYQQQYARPKQIRASTLSRRQRLARALARHGWNRQAMIDLQENAR